jgi:hypothetical protein
MAHLLFQKKVSQKLSHHHFYLHPVCRAEVDDDFASSVDIHRNLSWSRECDVCWFRAKVARACSMAQFIRMAIRSSTMFARTAEFFSHRTNQTRTAPKR